MKKLLPLAIALLAPVAQAKFDGSEPLLCTLMLSQICDYQGCAPPTAEDNVSNLKHLVVDFKRKRVKSPEAELEAPIAGTSVKDNRLFVAGVNERSGANEDDARSWTMAIASPTGTMTLTVAGEETAIVAFGSCTPVED